MYASRLRFGSVFISIISYLNLVWRFYYVFPWQWNVTSYWNIYIFKLFFVVEMACTPGHSNQDSCGKEKSMDWKCWFPMLIRYYATYVGIITCSALQAVSNHGLFFPFVQSRAVWLLWNLGKGGVLVTKQDVSCPSSRLHGSFLPTILWSEGTDKG